MSEDVNLDGSADALFGNAMNCDEAVHQLYHFLDGELTDERRAQISVHLTYCGPCGGAAEFEAEDRVGSKLRARGLIAPTTSRPLII